MSSVTIYTSSANETFTIPFHCAQCGLAANASIRAQGYASSIDYGRVDDMAKQDAYKNGWQMVSESACPRCAGPSVVFQERFAIWEKKARTRRMLRMIIGGIGAFLVFGSTAGCSTLYHDIHQAVPGLAIWSGFWSVIVLGLVLLLGPGRGPARSPTPSPNVVFG